MELIGKMYGRGEGVAQDDEQATAWFIRAADSGLASSMTLAYRSLAAGLGIEKDEQRAMSYLRAAERAGDEWAKEEVQRLIDTYLSLMSPDGNRVGAADLQSTYQITRLSDKPKFVALHASTLYKAAELEPTPAGIQRFMLRVGIEDLQLTALEWARRAAAVGEPSVLDQIKADPAYRELLD